MNVNAAVVDKITEHKLYHERHATTTSTNYFSLSLTSIRTSSTYTKAVEYLSRFFGVDESSCGEHPVITIIQRLHRTIANVEELKQHLISTNVSSNVNVHIFEHLQLQRQVGKYFKETAANICAAKCLMNKKIKVAS